MWSEMLSIAIYNKTTGKTRIHNLHGSNDCNSKTKYYVAVGTIKLQILGYASFTCLFAVSNFNTYGKQTRLLSFLNHSRKDLTRHGAKYLNRMLIFSTLYLLK